MPSVLIRNVDDALVCALKERAARHGRSLQQELHAIVDAALAEDVRRERQRRAYENAKRLGDELAATGRVFSDSTLDIRADRDSGYGHSW